MASLEIIHNIDMMAFSNQPINQIGPDEPGAAYNQI
jgi:hypothetical protein